MTYVSDKLHPLDPGVGELDRGDRTLEQAAIEALERRNRAITRRQFKILDQAAVRERGPYAEEDD